ncbi:HTH-type transcriptional regulator MntR [Kyrpidia spormannii]|uniref:Transcriptional regulator MntR n=4 Tax=Kyrpidia TaxID=1129704 RepID=A0ACA8ZAG2_9BACL|nr:Transcriptional regulator MntR [Kyrpidia spormannii]CAB3393922.1 HTH-type transcriptional regulator MntR [Kyrpidia spormannii]
MEQNPLESGACRMLTPSMEDYLETIYELMKEKGYARVSDIATILAVQPSSVTKMIQKLDEKNFVTYEKYRGLVLTPEGEQLGRNMKQRHRMLEDFLRLLGVGESTIRKDVEGIEHHISPSTMRSLQSLVLFFQEYPEYQRAFERFRRLQAGTAEDRSTENLKVMDE